jgi:hypothetical protein
LRSNIVFAIRALAGTKGCKQTVVVKIACYSDGEENCEKTREKKEAV